MKKTVICHFYNEEFLLPWWCKHHKELFDHGIMIDYASTDRSVEIIKEICPTWEIRPSRNDLFHPRDVDKEVMDIEAELSGWRIALNVTEFLYGNMGHIDKCTAKDKQFFIANYVFVDMEDPAKGSLELTYNKPLHEQRYWGYTDLTSAGYRWTELGGTYRLNRSIHNYPVEYPDWGRHWPDTKYSFDDLMIFYYGWADAGERGLARKLQIQKKVPEEVSGGHHNKDKVTFLEMYRNEQQPVSTDLRTEIEYILRAKNWKNTNTNTKMNI
jgi:hypothetical protein